MNAPSLDLAAALSRCRRLVDGLMDRRPTAADWADRAAESLLALDPSLRLALCWRTDGEPLPPAVRVAGGKSYPIPSEALGPELARLAGLGGAARPSPALGAVFGLRCVATCIPGERGPWALLAVGAAKDGTTEALALAEAALTACSDALHQRRRLESAERERDEFAGFALIGQAVCGLAHELNNLLNCAVLQASVLQTQLDVKYHDSLDVIRRHTLQATGLLRPVGQVAGDRAKAFYPVDLGRVLVEVLRDEPALAARVQFLPTPISPPPVRGMIGPVKQLVRLVLSAASADAPAPLPARIEREGAGVQLILEVPHVSDEEADGVIWNRLSDLERLAGQSLLRQLGGALRIERRPEGGVSIRVGWPAQ